MVLEDDLSEVNFELDSITIDQWEALYENIYSKYKKLKHKNKSLKSKLADHELVKINQIGMKPPLLKMNI